MKKNFLPLIMILLIPLFNGCITFYKVSYEIDLNDKSVSMVITDIRSDAKDIDEFTEDRKNLFDYMQKSPEFISTMKNEGKNIIHRELFVRGDTLNAMVIYRYDEFGKVEGISFEDGFYFLTLALDDSVISTNGEIILSKDHKRILWDKDVGTLKYEMLGNDFEEGNYKKLSQYFTPAK